MRDQFLILVNYALATYALPEKLLNWAEFQVKFNKNYSKDEIAYKYENFIQQRNYIESHNKRFMEGKETYFTDLNSFSDMSDEEFNSRNNYNEELPDGSTFTCATKYKPKAPIRIGDCLDCKDVEREDGKSEQAYFWQDPALNNDNINLVTRVKDQGSCGSCWAFAGAAVLEGKFCQDGLYDCDTWDGISPQEYVDCNLCDEETGKNDLTGNVCCFGCGGGWSQNAWYYVEKQGGTEDWNTYPYESGTTGKNYQCRYNYENNIFPPGRKITDRCIEVTGQNEVSMMQAVNEVGPIKVSIYVMGGFRSYAGGVYTEEGCPNSSTNHAVTLTGYGVLDGEAYWMVKNSWGPSYGLGGYIKMRRNYDSMCAIAKYPYWPTI